MRRGAGIGVMAPLGGSGARRRAHEKTAIVTATALIVEEGDAARAAAREADDVEEADQGHGHVTAGGRAVGLFWRIMGLLHPVRRRLWA